MESIQELAAEFLVAHANMRKAMEQVRTPKNLDYYMEISHVINDFDTTLRMMISQAMRMTRRAEEYIKNCENK